MRLISPVHFEDKGEAVSNLHKGLLFLILHQPGISDDDRSSLQQQLGRELRDQRFGHATLSLVKIWQGQMQNPKFKPNPVINGDVDDATAKGLNQLLADLAAV